MASLEKAWHKVVLDGEDAKIWLPDLYEGVGTALGITKITNDEAGTIKNTISVSEGLKAGQIVRLRLSVREALGKTKSARVLCSITEVRTAVANVVGKTYRGNQVRSAGIPRRRRLG